MDRLDRRLASAENGCIEWAGARNADGYGVIWVSATRKHDYTHRLAYVRRYGAIPGELVIDHLCKNRACCNPLHMEVVTREENTRRGDGGKIGGPARALIERAKTHCPYGHPYSNDNTYVTPKGHRQCRICKVNAKRKYDEKVRNTNV